MNQEIKKEILDFIEWVYDVNKGDGKVVFLNMHHEAICVNIYNVRTYSVRGYEYGNCIFINGETDSILDIKNKIYLIKNAYYFKDIKDSK